MAHNNYHEEQRVCIWSCFQNHYHYQAMHQFDYDSMAGGAGSAPSETDLPSTSGQEIVVKDKDQDILSVLKHWNNQPD